MGNAVALEKPRPGQNFYQGRMRRRKRAVTRYRIKEKSPRRRKIASGPHVDYNAHLYDPKLGRFLSVDPMIAHPGSTQSINPYNYVENNPLNKIDPTGMATCTLEVCNNGGGWNDHHSGTTNGPREAADAAGARRLGNSAAFRRAFPTSLGAYGTTNANATNDTNTHNITNKTGDSAGGGIVGTLKGWWHTSANAVVGAYHDFTGAAAYSAQWWANKQVAASNPFFNAPVRHKGVSRHEQEEQAPAATSGRERYRE